MSLSEQVRNLLLREKWTPEPCFGGIAYVTDKIDNFHCSVVGSPSPETWILSVETPLGGLTIVDAGRSIDELLESLEDHGLIEPEDEDAGKWDAADAKLSMALDEL